MTKPMQLLTAYLGIATTPVGAYLDPCTALPLYLELARAHGCLHDAFRTPQLCVFFDANEMYGRRKCRVLSVVTAKICSHRRVRVEISTRMRWFFLCWKFVIFHAKFMCGVSPYPTQPLFALPLHHWVPLQTLPTVGRLLPLQSVPKTILNFPKPCFQIVL